MKFVEINDDLFRCSKEYALVHCVSADFHMGAGIAVHFKSLFKNIQFLKSQNKVSGEVAILLYENQHIYYLVTKAHSWNKPTIKNFTNSLYDMKNHMLLNNVKKIAMPRIGCGLDRLSWFTVRNIIQSVFSDTEIEINVYYLSPPLMKVLNNLNSLKN